MLSVILPPFAQRATAAGLAGETFNGISTPANSWLSGGSGSVACLTAATSSAANSIPACPGGPIDTVGNGVLRLTPNAGNRSGFAIYNTPVSAADGLNITFDMYQYGGSGADGISFFLVDGAESPTQPGAAGGALGYASASNGETPGIVGGYVGVGFDRYGNFSNSDVGADGPGAQSNSIGIRGSEDTNYQFVTNTVADGSLSGTTRVNSKRSVKININTNNNMSVAVDYGSGYVTELAGIDLNDINGEGAMPETFKFGFAASTGGSTNMHEISGLSVETNPPSLGVDLTHTGSFVQGGTGQFKLSVGNDSSAESTDGLITATQTLPGGLTPTSASGSTWSCGINGQTVTCTRPGDGVNAINPGTVAPDITVAVAISQSATSPLVSTATVTTPDNVSLLDEDTDSVTILTGSYLDNDGIFNAVEDGAPNSGDGNDDGTLDRQQGNVTSLSNSVTGTYAVLESSGCASAANNTVSVAAEATNAVADGNYAYPAGLLNFRITCATPGSTATVTQYYYGTYNASEMAARKYNATQGTYQTIPDATLSNATVAGQPALKIVYQITDGGALDEDGTADGTIVDPAGPAVLASSITAPTSSTIGTPNTGLASQPMAMYYLAGILGVGVFVYEIASIRRRKGQHTTALAP